MLKLKLMFMKAVTRAATGSTSAGCCASRVWDCCRPAVPQFRIDEVLARGNITAISDVASDMVSTGA